MAARKPNRWLTEECPPADREVLDFADYWMSIYDHMPPKWRLLVGRYGAARVVAMYNSGGTADAAWMALEEQQQQRQAQWLATDYTIGLRI